jgi:uncharacterized membrane protein
MYLGFWGGRRDLNPRHSEPQSDALPAELRPPKRNDKRVYQGMPRRTSWRWPPAEIYSKDSKDISLAVPTIASKAPGRSFGWKLSSRCGELPAFGGTSLRPDTAYADGENRYRDFAISRYPIETYSCSVRETPLRFFAPLFLFAILFIGAGLSHFVFPQPYVRIMPPSLPWPKALVWISGAAEVAGGVGLLIGRFRRPAAYGLALLLVAVFQANIYMAVAHVRFPGMMGESWVQWLRLPLQLPLVLWALYYARKDRNDGASLGRNGRGVEI